MFKRILSVLLVLSVGFLNQSRADEGMWLPMLIKRLNEVDMQKEGLKLTAEEIYSVNNSSLKDAIVSLGGFCTAEMISSEGLMLTNHHCGFDAVQSHSSVEHDYITDGFWAMSRDQELPNEGLFVSFLVRMDDVTTRMKSALNDTMSEATRGAAIQKMIAKIQEENSESGRYKVDVKSFFQGNEFYMFVYEVFKDVRLVGAPPKSIGNYGGDTDNWMWPRHTGDFSMFRVYMSPDGKPAEYSKDNVPYKPKHFLPVNLSGTNKDDYAMVMGYPGRTDRYRYSAGVQMDIDQGNPAIVKIRTKRLDLIHADMESSDKIRIMYSAKVANVSNYWKYFIGQTKGLKRLGVVEQKQAEEAKFNTWVNSKPDLKAKYGNVTAELTKAYGEMKAYNLTRVYFQEAVLGNEILPYAYSYSGLQKILANKESKPEEIKKVTDQLKVAAGEFYKEYNPATDQKVFASLMELFGKDVAEAHQAPYFLELKKKYKGDFNKMAADLFAKSMFTKETSAMAFLNAPSLKQLDKDPAYKLVSEIYNHYVTAVRTPIRGIQPRLDKNMRLFVEGLREMNPNKSFYPDANSTMRVSYGKVSDYYPMDGVYYNYYTTIDGIMEKMDNTNEEFVVPAKMVELYKKKDYGMYGQNGTLRVNFITDNDITGGNSGSPVINGKGELIGLAFDGNWEAMSGDIAYDKVKRTICADIRYVLWVVDKFAGAGYLVKEMKVVN